MAVRDVIQAAAGALGGDKLYVEDVFSTWLYAGNNSTITVNNGIDLATEGGLVWIKNRTTPYGNFLFDTIRGGDVALTSNGTNQNFSEPNGVGTFNTNGFIVGGVGGDAAFNMSGENYASWTFRKAPKFFDVVTYTGDGVAGRQIAHQLGSVPGCIIVKNTSNAESWQVWHRSMDTGGGAGNAYILLNSTQQGLTDNGSVWGNVSTSTYIAPTSTNFTVSGIGGEANANGNTYVAYLFAHNAGGFGLTGTDNVISCGSYTGTGAAGNAVTLGYEPQWLMIKKASGATSTNWFVFDVMRGIATGGNDAALYPNITNAEFSLSALDVTATGFSVQATSDSFNTSGETYIYIAIRRGPMATPTSGTSVFLPSVKTDSENPQTVDTGFTVDMTWSKGNASSGTANPTVVDRLRGTTRTFEFNALNADGTNSNISNLIYSNGYINRTFTGGGATGYGMAFARAPQFFDEVCYTGTSPTNQNLAHNLQAVPELIISHNRVSGNNYVYSAALGPDFYLSVDSSMAANGPRSDFWGTTTASTFEVRNNVNNSGETFSAYLFASCPGVSKVGSFTGTGATQTINCGFTGGARFVLIKRTDDAGDWYVWDSARGIVSGNDPYLRLNSTAAEVTGTDYVDTYSAGFEISSTAPAAINASGGSFIFFAVA